MFPVSFARSVIAENTSVGDVVLDPFAGRGTSIFCAYESGREGLGCELSPLGWIYASTKLNPAPQTLVLKRLETLALSASAFEAEAVSLPTFFHHCYSRNVMAFLLSARAQLNWRASVTDRTLMAFILVYLHGKIGEDGRAQSLSNQMRQTKAMAPDYSVRWWTENGFSTPPEVCPLDFLTSRIGWRYQHGTPAFDRNSAKLGDCRTILGRERSRYTSKIRLLLTSPPYCGVTSYYYDQWLRAWMLGGSSHPHRDGTAWKGKFENRREYRQLLYRAFERSMPLLTKDATVYVRTDARALTLDPTIEVLTSLFPNKRLDVVSAPFTKPTQTSLFGDKAPKPGEMDLILRN